MLALACVFMSCLEDSTNSETKEQDPSLVDTTIVAPTSPDEEAVEVEDQNLLYLHTLYATSTAIGSSIHNIFDEDHRSNWISAQGTGPDEGIFLLFPKDQLNYIQSIEILKAEDKELAQIDKVLLYFNQHLQSFKFGKTDEKIIIEDELQSLYIRIFNTNKDDAKTIEQKNAAISIPTFPEQASVGIAAIRLFDQQGKAYHIIPPKVVKGKVSASSVLNPPSVYSAAHLFDGRTQTAWIEGAEAYGKNEFVNIELNQLIGVSGLLLWNGFQRSKEHFKSNSSVKQFSFGSRGLNERVFTLRDTEAGQFFELNHKTIGKQFLLSIQDVYKGTKYQDVALSELILMDDKRAISIETDFKQQLANTLKQQLYNTPLAARLNRRIMNTLDYKSDDRLAERSLILRDDGSFVYYSNTFTPSSDRQVKLAAEGQWVILETQTDEVKIKVLGNYRQYDEETLRRNSQKATDLNQLFSEIWTFKTDKVEGKTILEEIYY